MSLLHTFRYFLQIIYIDTDHSKTNCTNHRLTFLKQRISHHLASHFLSVFVFYAFSADASGMLWNRLKRFLRNCSTLFDGDARFEKKSTKGLALSTDARNCSSVMYHSMASPCTDGLPLLSGD